MDKMDAELDFRPFDGGDFERLAMLVGETWLEGRPPRCQRAAGMVETAHYLALTTWALVAERKGELLGAVLLSERGRPAIAGDWGPLEERLARDAAKDPGIAAAVRAEMDGVEEEASLEAEYAAAGAAGAGAAIKLLIVSPDARGLGIGGRLFSAALERLRASGASGYHLLTDDACDVSFYEHKGLACAMRRRSRVGWPNAGNVTGGFHVYVYEQRL